MVPNVLTSLEDPRMNTARINQPPNPSEIVNKSETYKLLSDKNVNGSEGIQEEFDFEDSRDNKLNPIVDQDKHVAWRAYEGHIDNIANVSDSSPLSPLSSTLASASTTLSSDVNDECFTSVSQGLKTYNFPGATNNKSDNLGIASSDVENSLRANTTSSPEGENTLKLREKSLVKDGTGDQEGVKGEIYSKVRNNLAGIVISSGPGGHFETFEGNGHSEESFCKIYSPSLVHAQNVDISIQGEVATNFAEQQPQDTAAAAEVESMLCNNQRSMVSNLGYAPNLSYTITEFAGSQIFNDNTPENTHANLSELIDSKPDVVASFSNIDINARKVPVNQSYLISNQLTANALLDRNGTIITHSNVTSNRDDHRKDLHYSTTHFTLKSCPTIQPSIIDKAISPCSGTLKCNNHNSACKYDKKFVTHSGSAKTKAHKKKRPMLHGVDFSTNKSKTIFQKSILKKIARGIESLESEALTKTINDNLETKLIPSKTQANVSMEVNLVSRTSNNQTHVDDDHSNGHGKYIVYDVIYLEVLSIFLRVCALII